MEIRLILLLAALVALVVCYAIVARMPRALGVSRSKAGLSTSRDGREAAAVRAREVLGEYVVVR